MNDQFDFKDKMSSELSDGIHSPPSEGSCVDLIPDPVTEMQSQKKTEGKTEADIKVLSTNDNLEPTNLSWDENKDNISKISRATSTDFDDDSMVKSSKCKYCKIRLSKLRLVEALKARKSSKGMSSYVNRSCFKKRMCTNKSSQTSAGYFEKAEMTERDRRNLAIILPLMSGKHKHIPFCKCLRQGKSNDCQCGETDEEFHWVWDPLKRAEATELSDDDRVVTFHTDFSCGTAAIRGQQAMKTDQYFWEIKMTTDVYGTDMMIGVGTESVDLNSFATTFCSMLGIDADSWGVSYSGYIQHDGHKQEYCSRFGQGALIGVHLDMWHGRVAFFKNRHPLGIAYSGLRGRALYPMVCSTAARSGMKVISSLTFPSSLQFLCFQRLRQYVPAHLDLLEALSMPPGLKQYFSRKLSWFAHSSTPQPPNPFLPRGICRNCFPLKGMLSSLVDFETSDTEDEQDLHLLVQSDDESESSDEDDEKYSFSYASSYLMKRIRSGNIHNQSDHMEGTSSSHHKTDEYPFGIKRLKRDSGETHVLDQEQDINSESSDDVLETCDQPSRVNTDDIVSDTEIKGMYRLSRKRKR